MDINIDRQALIQTLSDLVRINSINPSLSPQGKGEAEIGAYVADSLSSLGLEVTTYEIEPGRVNAVGILKGSGAGPSLLLNAHMDTVGVDGMLGDPFDPELREGRMYGRGTQDMKGSLAAMIAAAKALVDSGIELGGDVVIAGVADEEYTSLGTRDLVKRIRTQAAIVTEPTDLAISRAHRGFIWYDVETFGRAAHGSRYQDGVDANMHMGRFLSRLDGLERELRERPAHPLVGPPSLHAARLQGGTELSIYAAHCLLQVERRTAPGETEADATAELQSLVDQLASEDPTFKARVKPTLVREPFEISAQAGIVQTLEMAVAGRLGHSPGHSGQYFWTDAALLAAAGIETALLGPTGGGLHSKEEWVELQSVLDLAAILAETARIYCC